ncbi:MAG: methyltransferase [Actinobacteria bacterium]|nr:methyltransferase [Actinomycetota bacterium]
MPLPQPASGDHYFTSRPGAPSALRRVELVLPEGRLVTLATDRGVFSAQQVDPGTRVLLAEGPPVAVGGTLVDVGCGYGPIAVALALRAGPEAVVWAVDVNERARDLCRANAAANGVADQVRVVAPEEVPADLVADQIWSNPPIRVGKAVLHDLLRSWLGRLRPTTGSACLVVQKHLGADSLARWLDDQGWPTRRVASRGGYRVLVVDAAEGS